MVELADVSVVMPAYNSALTIDRALASIAAQTLRPREVIVVDDGSTDDTATTALAQMSRLGNIALRVFRQSNSGAGAARNRGIAEARGEWLAFLDADDQWLPDKLSRSLDVMRTENLTMSAHNLFGVDERGDHLIDSRKRWLEGGPDTYNALFQRGFISSSTVVVRRDAVLRVGGFDHDLRSAQDYELWLALLADADCRFTLFAAPLLRYTLTESGITGNIDRKVACSLAILDRHMGVLRRRVAKGGLGLVAMRLVIIHYEAIQAYRARGRLDKAAWHAVMFAPRLLGYLLRFAKADGYRPDFIGHLVPAKEVLP